MSKDRINKEKLRRIKSHMENKVVDARIQLARARHRQERNCLFLFLAG